MRNISCSPNLYPVALQSKRVSYFSLSLSLLYFYFSPQFPSSLLLIIILFYVCFRFSFGIFLFSSRIELHARRGQQHRRSIGQLPHRRPLTSLSFTQNEQREGGGTPRLVKHSAIKSVSVAKKQWVGVGGEILAGVPPIYFFLLFTCLFIIIIQHKTRYSNVCIFIAIKKRH